ncbi:hypothetical protein [Azospirillum sp. B506]|uniref:hypothetical protein n=1 Tax=Azospirillum sp. B506 TaxID=137721 RepID=UPI0003471717|nr:hypothetical protein [Azospirillum sp. B506]
MKTLIVSSLAVGAVILVGALSTPVRAQGTASPAPAAAVQPTAAQRLMGDAVSVARDVFKKD